MSIVLYFVWYQGLFQDILSKDLRNWLTENVACFGCQVQVSQILGSNTIISHYIMPHLHSTDVNGLICYWLQRHCQVKNSFFWMNSQKTIMTVRDDVTYCIKCVHNDRIHDEVMTWKHFLHYWPFVRGIHWLPVDSLQKGVIYAVCSLCS